jgi:hypothetical protein
MSTAIATTIGPNDIGTALDAVMGLRDCNAHFVAGVVQKRLYKEALAQPVDGTDTIVVLVPLVEEVCAATKRFIDACGRVSGAESACEYVRGLLHGADLEDIGEALVAELDRVGVSS